MRSIFFLSLTVLTLSACGPKKDMAKECAAPQTDGSEFSGVVNGKILKADGPLSSRIALIRFYKGVDLMECTGAILPNNVVLTAGHCVPASTESIKVGFAADADCSGLSAENTRKVSQIVSNPDYVRGKPEYDMAMVKFEGTLPAGFQSFQIPGDSVNLSQEENLIMLGYGKTSESDDSSASVLRITANKVSSLVSLFDVDTSLTYSISQPTTGVCSGDSGGPLVIMRGGLPKIIGVASQARGDSEAELCHGRAVYARTDAKAQWIRETYIRLTR